MKDDGRTFSEDDLKKVAIEFMKYLVGDTGNAVRNLKQLERGLAVSDEVMGSCYNSLFSKYYQEFEDLLLKMKYDFER